MIAFLSSGTVYLTDSITLQSDVARLHHTCVQMSVSQRPDKGPMGIKNAAFMLNEYMSDAAKSTVHHKCLYFCCSLSSMKKKSTQTTHTVAAYLGSLHCHHQYSSVTNPCLGFRSFVCFAVLEKTKLDHIKKNVGYIIESIIQQYIWPAKSYQWHRYVYSSGHIMYTGFDIGCRRGRWWSSVWQEGG